MEGFRGSADDGGLPPSSVPEEPWWVEEPEPVSDEAEEWDGSDYPAYLDDPSSDPGRADYECRDWEAEEDHGFSPVILHPVAVAARNRQRSVEALMAGLAGVDAAEAQLHALRVLMVRGIAGLLGADSASELDRCRAPSLTAAEIAAERALPPRAAKALVAEALALTAPEARPVLAAVQEGRLDRPGPRPSCAPPLPSRRMPRVPSSSAPSRLPPPPATLPSLQRTPPTGPRCRPSPGRSAAWPRSTAPRP